MDKNINITHQEFSVVCAALISYRRTLQAESSEESNASIVLLNRVLARLEKNS